MLGLAILSITSLVSQAKATAEMKYSNSPSYTSPRLDIGMNIFLATG